MYEKAALSLALLTLISFITDAANPPAAPVMAVYANGMRCVENVCVSVTNPDRDTALAITSVEFQDQLPELRYFFHGIYGRISRSGDNYKHDSWAQELSIPVSSCFLLPGQSTNTNALSNLT